MNEGIERPGGVILCGGQGRRMLGQDKGLLPYRGRPLLEHVLERIQPQTQALCISANRNLQQYRRYGLPVLTDVEADFPGPLAGVQVAMHWCRLPWLLVVPCDSPHLPADLAQQLLQAAKAAGAPGAYARAGGSEQPIVHIMRTELAGELQRWRHQGGAAVRAWLAHVGACPLDFADAQAFANCNTPSSLQD